jgi:hypothetical protein
LQRTIGNQGVLRLLRDHTDPEDQIKEALGTTSDTPDSSQSDKTRKIVSGGGSGEPLLPDARAEMEARFGYDLSRVRIHTNDQTAAALGAKAFTNGHEISFRPGRSPSDRRLLTHEIAHVVQQTTGESAHLHAAGGDALRREALEDRADNPGGQTAPAARTPYQSLKPLAEVSSPVIQFAFEEDVLSELHRMPSAEEEGISEDEQRARVAKLGARAQRLDALFNGLSADEARGFHERLKARKRGDTLSERFHDMLSEATRRALLTVLESRMDADVLPPASGPPIGIIRRDAQKVKISGLPADQPNYADGSFRGLLSAPMGDVYELCTQPVAKCQNAISIPKTEFSLDGDPLTKGMPILIQSVYPSRDVAEAVLADMRVDTPKDMPLVTYYLRDGIIFPTTLSETTLPNLIPQVRAKRDADRGDVNADAELAEAVTWWYVGARIPFRIKSGGGGVKVPPPVVPVVPATKAALSAAEVAEELFVATKSITGNVKKMLAAARQLSSMGGLTAAQKAEVMMAFFQKIGSGAGRAFGVALVKGAPWVDEGLHLLMVSQDGKSAFRFIKSTGEILLGKLNPQTMQFVWGPIL